MRYIIDDKINGIIRSKLTERRYIHSLGVAEMAENLGKKYGADPEKLYYAGFVHDIAKCLSDEEMNRYIRYYGLDLKYMYNPPLAHSKIGAEIVNEVLCVDDINILNAISYHTTGRAYMSIYEEIMYVADAVEKNRSYNGVRRLRRLARFDLDETCREILEHCIAGLRHEDKMIDSDTLEALEWIREKINKKRRTYGK